MYKYSMVNGSIGDAIARSLPTRTDYGISHYGPRFKILSPNAAEHEGSSSRGGVTVRWMAHDDTAQKAILVQEFGLSD